MIFFLNPDEIRAAVPEYTDPYGFRVDVDNMERVTFSRVGGQEGLLAVARWESQFGKLMARSAALNSDFMISEQVYALVEKKLQNVQEGRL